MSDTLTLNVGSLDSIETQLPFPYFTAGFCSPDKLQLQEDNLGEILTGEQIYNTDYTFDLNLDHQHYCSKLCLLKLDKSKIKYMIWFIQNNYFSTWYLDSLPAALNKRTIENNKDYLIYNNEIPLGEVILVPP